MTHIKIWKSYQKYKSSGIRWLSDIPAHWKLSKLKFLSKIILSNVDKKTVEGESKVQLCNYTDVYNNDLITSDIEFMTATANKNQIKSLSIKANDIIITKDSETSDDIAVPAYVPETIPGVVCGYHLALLRPFSSKIFGKFLFYCLKSEQFNDQFKISANGITRFGISKSDIQDSIFLEIPLPEQRAIANFLDHQTSKIDALIEKLERLIELLEEKRNALIAQAVTKGLDPDVPMKDSGVEWLGEIPEHWKLQKAKFLFKELSRPICDEDQVVTAFRDGEVTLRTNRRTEGFTFSIKEIGYQGVRKGDLVIHQMDGFAGAIGVSDSDGKCSPVYSVCKPKVGLNNYFYAHMLRHMAHSGYITSLAKGIRQRSTDFRFNTFGEELLPIFTIEEQNQIYYHIKTKTSEIDSWIRKIHNLIDIFHEYRSSIISAAVTGKIDVHDWREKDIVDLE